MITQAHTVYIDKIQQELMTKRGVYVSIPTVACTLHRLDFTCKRTSRCAIKQNELMRAAYMNRVGTLVPDPNMLMFTDQTVKDERTTARQMGWLSIGTPCVQPACFVCGHRYSVLPFLTLDGLITWDIIEGSITSEQFVKFLHEMVVCSTGFSLSNLTSVAQIPLTNPYPGPCSVLVLDMREWFCRRCRYHPGKYFPHLKTRFWEWKLNFTKYFMETCNLQQLKVSIDTSVCAEKKSDSTYT